jgi:hypothetical protein
MLVNKLFLILIVCASNSRAEEELEFLSIERVNQLLQERAQELTDVFGQNVGYMPKASSVKAFLVGGVEDPGIERYGVFPLKGKFMDIDPQTAKVFYQESNVSLYALGMGMAKFALIYQGERAEHKVVILISPPESEDDKIWTFIECNTRKSAYFGPNLIPLLSKIWKTLQDQEKQSADNDKAKPNSK